MACRLRRICTALQAIPQGCENSICSRTHSPSSVHIVVPLFPRFVDSTLRLVTRRMQSLQREISGPNAGNQR
jgi:hypothetical protein